MVDNLANLVDIKAEVNVKLGAPTLDVFIGPSPISVLNMQ